MKQFLSALLLAVLCWPVFAQVGQHNTRSHHVVSSPRNHLSLQNAHSQQSLVKQGHIRTSALSRINTAQNNEISSCCLKTKPSNSIATVKTSPDFVSSNATWVNPRDFQSNTQGLLFIAKDIPSAGAAIPPVAIDDKTGILLGNLVTLIPVNLCIGPCSTKAIPPKSDVATPSSKVSGYEDGLPYKHWTIISE
jgi:hypothetical protein